MYKKKLSTEYWLKSELRFGKYKGSTIEEILKEERTYVTEFLIKKLGYTVHGIERVKVVKDSCWGYDASAGLVGNHSFYRDYIVSKAKDSVVRIACKWTGLIVEGKTLGEAEHNLNMQLDEAFGKCNDVVV